MTFSTLRSQSAASVGDQDPSNFSTFRDAHLVKVIAGTTGATLVAAATLAADCLATSPSTLFSTPTF